MEPEDLSPPIPGRSPVGDDVHGQVGDFVRRRDHRWHEGRHADPGKLFAHVPDRGRVPGEVVAEAPVDLEVDQPGRDDQALGVDRGGVGALSRDDATVEMHLPGHETLWGWQPAASDSGHGRECGLAGVRKQLSRPSP